MPANKNNRKNLFTLVELVVSIGILVVVTGIIAMASMTFYTGYERTAAVAGKLKEYMAIDNIADTHIRNMIPFHWLNEDEAVEQLIFSGTENMLFFTAIRRNYGKNAGSLLFIRLSLEENMLIAEYSPYPRLPWLESSDEKMSFQREILAAKVASVSFRYAEVSTEQAENVEWFDYWDEEEHEDLPLAILMTVTWLDGRREQWLRRVAGSSHNSTFGVRSSIIPEGNLETE